MTTLSRILHKQNFCVIYRTGGTDNYQWHRSLAMTREEANKACQDTQQMGYHAFVGNYDLSVNIGLPEGYSYGS